MNPLEEVLLSPIQTYYFSILSVLASILPNRVNSVAFLGFLLFAYLSFLAGKTLLGKLGIVFSSPLKNLIYSLMAGYGIFGAAGLIFGLLGLFSAFWFWIFSIIILALSCGEVLVHLKKVFLLARAPAESLSGFKSFLRRRSFAETLVVLWVLANLFIVFVPITGHDTLDYHLPIMADIMQKHRITFSADIDKFYGYLPVMAEIIYAVPTAMFGNKGDPYVFQILQYSALILLAGIVFEFLKPKVANKFFAAAGVIFILSITELQKEALHGGYVDVLTFLFAVASLLLAIESFGDRKISEAHLILSAIMLGFSLSMKYTAIYFVAINCLILLMNFWSAGVSLRGALAKFLKYAFVAGVVAGFWYGKNLLVWGDPVYPMFSGGFNGSIAFFAMDRTFANFFAFPFYMFGRWFIDDTQSSSLLISAAYFAAIYLLLLFFIFAARKKIALQEALIFFSLELYLLFLFSASHQLRFLLPSVILAALLLAMFLDKFFFFIRERLGESAGRIFWKISFFCINAVFLIIFLGNFHYFGVKYLYLTGIYDRRTYIHEIGGQ